MNKLTKKQIEETVEMVRHAVEKDMPIFAYEAKDKKTGELTPLLLAALPRGDGQYLIFAVGAVVDPDALREQYEYPGPELGDALAEALHAANEIRLRRAVAQVAAAAEDLAEDCDCAKCAKEDCAIRKEPHAPAEAN